MTTPDRTHIDADEQAFDLEELVHVEETFYKVGYEDGYAHGRLHGLVEGRALGAEKGFELWEELGFYEGAARLWTAVALTDAGGVDSRGAHHASALLALIERFPRKNPRPDEDGVDMGAQLRLIRSRYKAMCASFGVRARLQPAAAVAVEDGPGLNEDMAGDQKVGVGMGAKKKGQAIWALSSPASASTQGLSF
ncbi:DUF1715-domain-containing protein [Lactarius hatsudake]|nr:DUF1715-domain-containing protein [Lactarius hatsudake]KAH8985249.1 DUF1715-domain-containing protein [Lactarius hatsudake]